MLERTATAAERQAKAAADATESANVAVAAAVETARYTRHTALWMGLSVLVMVAWNVFQVLQG
jgi:hypothetical protein